MNVVEHAVRCDMRTLEELHADRLWVTKYGWEERTNGSKKESNSVELQGVGRMSQRDRQRNRERGNEMVKSGERERKDNIQNEDGIQKMKEKRGEEV